MAGAKKPKNPNVASKAKDGKAAVDRFENDWGGVPNFKLSKPAAKKPTSKKK